MPILKYQIFFRHLTSLQQLDVETNGNHEEVDVVEALLRHIRGQGLRDADGIHHTVLYCKDQPLLFLRVCVHTKRRKELPHIYVLAGNDSAGEDIR